MPPAGQYFLFNSLHYLSHDFILPLEPVMKLRPCLVLQRTTREHFPRGVRVILMRSPPAADLNVQCPSSLTTIVPGSAQTNGQVSSCFLGRCRQTGPFPFHARLR